MRYRGAVALLATAAGCVGAGVAVPSSARFVAAEPMATTTTITATKSGTADLVLYDDATLSPKLTHNPDVVISGPGRFVGFRLSRSDSNDELTGVRMPKFAGGLSYVGGSTDAPQPSCTQPVLPIDGSSCAAPPAAKAIVLHEGYYRLAVLTDGGPLRITLRLHGQHRARSAVRIQTQVRTAEADLKQLDSIGSSTITYGVETANAGALNAQMIVRAKLHPNAKFLAASSCARHDSGTPPPYAFSPACAGGASRGLAWASNNGVQYLVGGVGGLSVYDLAGMPVDPTGLGGSYVDTDGPTYLGGLGIWTWNADLDFIGTPLTPVPGQ